MHKLVAYIYRSKDLGPDVDLLFLPPGEQTVSRERQRRHLSWP